MSRLHPVEMLLQWLYRFDEPNGVRDRPMKVLALGLSRCGTDSLRIALEELGYKGVWHGWDVKGDQSMAWTRLWDAKVAGNTIGVDDFDRLIGNYEAVTEAPIFFFAKELIEAYPDAKVILNRRKDVTMWERSYRSTVLVVRDSWFFRPISLFSQDLFWMRQLSLRLQVQFFNGSFEKYGVNVYLAHYRQLEEMMGEGKYLKWAVEDGWYVTVVSASSRVPHRLIMTKGAIVRFS